MIYYRAKREFEVPHKTKKYCYKPIIQDALYTLNEWHKITNVEPEQCKWLEKIEISKNKTHMMFGVRFENNYISPTKRTWKSVYIWDSDRKEKFKRALFDNNIRCEVAGVGDGYLVSCYVNISEEQTANRLLRGII